MNRSQQGFTLVELLVAVVIFSVGLLALASSSAVMMRTLGESQSKTVAAAVAESRFERIRSTACANRTSGSAVSRGPIPHPPAASKKGTYRDHSAQ